MKKISANPRKGEDHGLLREKREKIIQHGMREYYFIKINPGFKCQCEHLAGALTGLWRERFCLL